MIIKLDFRTKLFMTIVLSYVMVLGNIQKKYFVQAILISTIPIILLINAKYIRVDAEIWSVKSESIDTNPPTIL